LTAPLRHGAQVLSVVFSPDGRRVVTVSSDQTARAWYTFSGQPLGEAWRHPASVLAAQFSPDGARVVTVADDRTARLWDLTTGQPLGEPLGHADGIASAQFSPEGQRVVTASSDGTARVWDAPAAPLPVAPWLADLAEAIAGRRNGAQGIPQLLAGDQVLALKRRLEPGAGPDFYTRWARWFFSDRGTRPRSPFAPLAAEEAVGR
jgi:dipeptidyl aminopeptidase/acylaminoacyl peptidase